VDETPARQNIQELGLVSAHGLVASRAAVV
jgi:hypothetical protein